MKKLVALVLALALCLSLCTVAFAESITFEEFFAQYAPDFPTTKEKAWTNGSYSLYLNEGVLQTGRAPIWLSSPITADGTNFTYSDYVNTYKFVVSDGKLSSIFVNDEEFFLQSNDTDFNLLSLIGAYWTAKYVYGLVKEASTMPYLAPIVKLAVPTAVAALCLKVVSHAVWHLR